MTWWDERSVGPLPAVDGGVASEETESSSSIEAAAAAASSTTTAADEEGASRLPLLATVDLEDPYLRDLVLEAFKSRSKLWRVERADGVPREATREGEEEERAAAKGDEDGACSSSSSEEEEEEEQEGEQEEEQEEEEEEEEEEEVIDLLPHPLASSSRFHWGEYERIDWDRVASGKTMASSYAVRKGLTRKAQLAFGLKKWCAKRPQSALVGCFPETHVLQVDDVDYIDEALCDLPEVRDAPEGAARWIVKPSMTNRAAGVAVVDGCLGLRRALEAIPTMREWVVQRYVDNPLLLPRRKKREEEEEEVELEDEEEEEEEEEEERGGGKERKKSNKLKNDRLLPPRKWHVRSYALCVGALKVYSFGGMLALSARAGYKDAPIDNLDAHLTNTCRRSDQKKEGGAGGGESDGDGDGDGDGEGNESDGGDDRIMLLSEIPELLSQEEAGRGGGEGASSLTLPEAAAKTRRLAARISELVAETFAAVSSELTFFALPSAFELFGFDFLVDEAWNPWLLEANADPDVGASGGRLRGVIGEMVEGVLRLTADELVASGAEEGGGGEGEPEGLEKKTSPPPPSSAEGIGCKGSEEEGDDDPLALRWRLVFERDSGREGAGFRVG